MLELNRISAGYGKQTVLDGISVDFEKGKLTSIIGVNGCGKSTLLKAILGILPLSGGEIFIDGENLLTISRNEIAKKIAYLSQGKNIPDMTVEQMVLHGRFPFLSYPRRYSSHDREVAIKAMETVGVAEFARKPLYSLSGGMRQNAYIAMALAQDTDYILLDEPTTYLDIAHQLDLMRILRKLADSGKGIVTVMHDLPIAFDFSDKLTVMSNGKIIAYGTPSEICKSHIVEDIFGVKIKQVQKGKYLYEY
ncbi:MAG: ABC transporter ATP-binding protein [Clostridia bacterium]|nr:ABC transporter ATP-binding protein [Clostridia bacterium]